MLRSVADDGAGRTVSEMKYGRATARKNLAQCPDHRPVEFRMQASAYFWSLDSKFVDLPLRTGEFVWTVWRMLSR